MKYKDSDLFADECANLGLCPACLNNGDANDHDLDLLGDCQSCGHKYQRVSDE